MATNQSDLARDMAYGQRAMFVTTPDDDRKRNIDYRLGRLTIAYRRRRFRLNKYHELSIRARRASGTETEMSKIIHGRARAILYAWEFIDCWVFAIDPDILACLRDPERHYIQPNKDHTTSACYIKLDDIPHLIVWKPTSRNNQKEAHNAATSP